MGGFFLHEKCKIEMKKHNYRLVRHPRRKTEIPNLTVESQEYPTAIATYEDLDSQLGVSK